MTLSAGSWAAQAINLGMQVLLARMLGPSEFGLYAFCFAISEFLSIVGAFSLQLALVQSREVDDRDYDTAFAICAALGVIGILLAAAVAPFLWAGRGPEAAWVLLLMMVAGMGRFLAQPPQARLERSMRYGAVTLTTTLAAVVPNFIAVGLAWSGLGVWSLALRDVLVGLSFFVLSMLVSGYRFRGRLSRESWTWLMDFSRPLFVSRALETVIERLDGAAVGLFLGNRQAGLYHWARSLSEIGYLATRPLERISLNLYSRLQDDPPRLSRAFGLVNVFLLRALLLGSTTLFAAPVETVRLILGEEWIDVAPLLRWLALYAVVMPVLNNVKVLLYGNDQVRTMVRVRVLQGIVLAVGVLAASWAGSTEGVAAALLGSNLLAIAVAVTGARQLVRVELGRLVGPPLLAAVLAVSVSQWLVTAELAARIPWVLWPLVPALLFAAFVAVLEGRRIAADLRFLRDQFAAGSSSGAGGRP